MLENIFYAGSYLFIFSTISMLVYRSIKQTQARRKQERADAKLRMIHAYASQALQFAIGTTRFHFDFVAPESAADLPPGKACWARAVLAYAETHDYKRLGSRAKTRWLNLDELNGFGLSAKWQPGWNLLLYRFNNGEFAALVFGTYFGLTTQLGGGYDPTPTPLTHTFKVTDLGGMPDEPLRKI